MEAQSPFQYLAFFGSWVKVLTFRFFKGIRDGLIFTPVFEVLILLYRALKAKRGA